MGHEGTRIRRGINNDRMLRVCTYVYIRIARVPDKWCLEAESAHFHWQIVGSSTLVYVTSTTSLNRTLRSPRAPLEFRSRNRLSSIQKRQDDEDWHGARINQGRAVARVSARDSTNADCRMLY